MGEVTRPGEDRVDQLAVEKGEGRCPDIWLGAGLGHSGRSSVLDLLFLKSKAKASLPESITPNRWVPASPPGEEVSSSDPGYTSGVGQTPCRSVFLLVFPDHTSGLEPSDSTRSLLAFGRTKSSFCVTSSRSYFKSPFASRTLQKPVCPLSGRIIYSLLCCRPRFCKGLLCQSKRKDSLLFISIFAEFIISTR